MSKLNEAQKFYIQNNRDKTLEELAKDSGTKVETIQEFLESLPVIKKEQSVLLKMTKQPQKGVHVLTRQAAERGDAIRQGIRSRQNKVKYNDCIAKIYDEDNSNG